MYIKKNYKDQPYYSKTYKEKNILRNKKYIFAAKKNLILNKNHRFIKYTHWLVVLGRTRTDYSDHALIRDRFFYNRKNSVNRWLLLVRKWAGFLRCWIIELCLGFPATWNNRDIFLSRRNFQFFRISFVKKRCKKFRENKLKMRNSGLVELVKNRIHTESFIRTTQGFQNPSYYSNSTLWKRTNQLIRLTRSESNAKTRIYQSPSCYFFFP